jgi:hypothetical protein
MDLVVTAVKETPGVRRVDNQLKVVPEPPQMDLATTAVKEMFGVGRVDNQWRVFPEPLSTMSKIRPKSLVRFFIPVGDRVCLLDVCEGAATLRGTVSTQSEMDQVAKQAKTLPGGQQLDNQVKIDPRASKPTHPDFAQPIVVQIGGRLRMFDLLGDTAILRGNVASQREMDQAVKAVKRIPDVHRVDNQLQIVASDHARPTIIQAVWRAFLTGCGLQDETNVREAVYNGASFKEVPSSPKR